MCLRLTQKNGEQKTADCTFWIWFVAAVAATLTDCGICQNKNKNLNSAEKKCVSKWKKYGWRLADCYANLSN